MITALIVIFFFFIAVFSYRKNLQVKKQLEMTLAELDSCQKKVGNKDVVAEDIAYKIQSSATVIMGYLELIKQNSLSPMLIDKFIQLAKQDGRNLIEILNDLLLLSTSRAPFMKSKQNFESLEIEIKETASSFKEIAELKNISLHYKSNIRENLEIELDYQCLTKAIKTLISNALKHSGSQTSIYINSSLKNKELSISIKDEGEGMSKDKIDAIFDWLHNFEKQPIKEDLDIELLVVHLLISKLQGTMHIESEEGIGSLFVIKVPLPLENESIYLKEILTPYERLTDEPYPQSEGKRLPKVLVIDHSLSMVSFLKNLFSSYFDCTFTFNGKEALKMIQSEQFDLIVCDSKLSVMNEEGFREKLKEVCNHQKLPFLMIMSSLKNQNIDLGINNFDYIIKPFSTRDILAKISKLLEPRLFLNIFKKGTQEGLTGFQTNYYSLFEKLYNVILKEMSNPDLDLERLSKELGYTQRELSKITLSKTGLTLVQVIKEVRLLNAYELLENKTYKTVKEVVFAIGLNSRSYFYKTFVSRFGIKPSDLLQKNDLSITPP